MGKRPPWVFVVSIVLFLVRIYSQIPPNIGDTPTGHAFDLIGISPLRGSHRGVLVGCDGSRLCYRFNARPDDWTQVSQLPLPVMAFASVCAEASES